MKRNYWLVVSWIVLWGAFYLKGVWMIDPDFGQHVRTGELIVKSGLPITDPFSYTMPEWRYIDHAWLSDAAMWWGYRVGGSGLLAAIYAAMATGALWLVTNKGRWGVVTALLAAAVFMGKAGVRQQVLDWLAVAVILKFFEIGVWKKWKWLLPIVFGLWVNLHSGAAMGLAILGAGLAGMVLERKLKWSDAAVVALTVVAVVINPYGPGLWKEIGEVANDNSLRNTIAEWRPWYGAVDFGFWMLAAMTAMWGWRYRKEIGWGEKLMLGGTFLAGLSSLRHMAVFAVVAGWVLGRTLEVFEKDVGKGVEVKQRLDWFYKLMVGVALLVLVVQGGIDLWGSRQLAEEEFYPKKAVEWLRKEHERGNLFSDYGWGGYLIWKLPEKRTFVDGRMPSWKGPQGSAFEEFMDITWKGKEFGPIFEKYGVDIVLWPKRELAKSKALINVTWGKSDGKAMWLPTRLEEAGWEKVYEDEVAIVMVRG